MRFLFAAAVTLLTMKANALEPATVTIESVSSTATIMGIAISSQPNTSVIISTSPLYRQVCVQNLDVGNFLACGDNVNVSTIAASALAGVVISTAATGAATPNVPYCFPVVAGKNFYCGSSSITGSSRAVIIRKR